MEHHDEQLKGNGYGHKGNSLIVNISTKENDNLFLNLNGNRFNFHQFKNSDFNPLLAEAAKGGFLHVLSLLLNHLNADYNNEDVIERVVLFAQDAVSNYEKTLIFLKGTILPKALYQRHPNNSYATRSNKRLKLTPSSPLIVFKGNSGVLETIARYVCPPGSPQQMRTLHQLIHHLFPFIDNVEEEETVDEDEEDEDEEDDDMHDSSLVCAYCNDRTEQDIPVFVCPRCGTALCELCENMLVRHAPVDNLDVCHICWTDADDAMEEDNETSDESDDDEDDDDDDEDEEDDETSDVEMF